MGASAEKTWGGGVETGGRRRINWKKRNWEVPGMGAPKIPWDEIRTKYIAGRQSCRELAEEYGIRAKMVSDRCAKEGWRADRKAYRESTGKKALAQASRAQARELAGLLRASDRMVQELERLLQDNEQFYRYLSGEETTEERVFKKADTKAMRNVATALREMTSVMRNLYGLPTQAEAESQRVAAERLELEKEKTAQQKGGGAVVSLEGMPDEYSE